MIAKQQKVAAANEMERQTVELPKVCLAIIIFCLGLLLQAINSVLHAVKKHICDKNTIK